MSFILKSGEQISKSPCNNSLSKQMYTFSKEKRFNQKLRNLTTTEFSCKIPNKNKTRSTSFGIGSRSYSKNLKYSTIPFYNLPSSFLTNKNKQEKSINKSNLIDKKEDCYIKPFSSKDKFNVNQNTFYNIPINLEYINVTSRSIFKNPKSDLRNLSYLGFGISGSNDMEDKNSNSLKPKEDFRVGDLILNGKNGSNFNKKLRTNISFGRKQSTNINKSACKKLLKVDPGPGEYIIPSEFGIYGNKNHIKDHSLQKNIPIYSYFNSKNSTK